MTKKEKLLLLDLLMRDIRGAFPENEQDERLVKVLELSKELGLELYNETLEWLKKCDYLDGRQFRDCETNYDIISKMHNLKPTYKDKSHGFCMEAMIIKHKEYFFTDYKNDNDYALDTSNKLRREIE